MADPACSWVTTSNESLSTRSVLSLSSATVCLPPAEMNRPALLLQGPPNQSKTLLWPGLKGGQGAEEGWHKGVSSSFQVQRALSTPEVDHCQLQSKWQPLIVSLFCCIYQGLSTSADLRLLALIIDKHRGGVVRDPLLGLSTGSDVRKDGLNVVASANRYRFRSKILKCTPFLLKQSIRSISEATVLEGLCIKSNQCFWVFGQIKNSRFEKRTWGRFFFSFCVTWMFCETVRSLPKPCSARLALFILIKPSQQDFSHSYCIWVDIGVF